MLADAVRHARRPAADNSDAVPVDLEDDHRNGVIDSENAAGAAPGTVAPPLA